MQHQRLTFEDIMQSKILYYDKNVEIACFGICKHLKIDNLPALDGEHFYLLQGNKFVCNIITDEHKVSSSENIFNLDIIAKIKRNKHNVLFVFHGNVLCGIVHISDYNRDVVLQSIQDDFLIFERQLRLLIILNGYENKDMRNYFKRKKENAANKSSKFYENKIINYDRRSDEIASLSPFQAFEFSDLMGFANDELHPIHRISSRKYNDAEYSGIELLRELRNVAMHSKNPISKSNESSIYSEESLQHLVNCLTILREECGSVSFKIRQNRDFMETLELENKSKLEIIHNHHSRAIEYFIGI